MIRSCYFAVSYTGVAKKKEPIKPIDSRLAAAWKKYIMQRPQDLVWQSREGLSQSLNYAAKFTYADIRRHVVVHLLSRIKKYIIVRLAAKINSSNADAASDIGSIGSVVKHIATAVTEYLTYNQKQEFAIAKKEKREPRPIPNFVTPTSVRELLGVPESDDGKLSDRVRSMLIFVQKEVAVYAIQEEYASKNAPI